ncbi:type II toxin-antitoxin system RelE/ParE family toxin [Gracilimonas sp.]|uniref:type II toxin-antitoxin system RelE family toxin n=1 Tax=Gracilimonas sp. TaxID=1974203 RepID=UPI0028715B06|nr:hypothetical protein [Gracilimonas sp.]
MISRTTDKFWKYYERLPENVKEKAKKAYQYFEENPAHPSLRFKKVNDDPKVYSVRISIEYRALGVLEGNEIIWFWVGSHDDYEELINQF